MTCFSWYLVTETEGSKRSPCWMRAVRECAPTASPPAHHNRFTALFPGPPGWAGARRELLDFMVQGEINRGRHTDHPAGHHSIRTNQCPSPPSPLIFDRPDALPATQPTAPKHYSIKWMKATLKITGRLLSIALQSMNNYVNTVLHGYPVNFVQLQMWWHYEQ